MRAHAEHEFDAVTIGLAVVLHQPPVALRTDKSPAAFPKHWQGQLTTDFQGGESRLIGAAGEAVIGVVPEIERFPGRNIDRCLAVLVELPRTKTAKPPVLLFMGINIDTRTELDALLGGHVPGIDANPYRLISSAADVGIDAALDMRNDLNEIGHIDEIIDTCAYLRQLGAVDGTE